MKLNKSNNIEIKVAKNTDDQRANRELANDMLQRYPN